MTLDKTSEAAQQWLLSVLQQLGINTDVHLGAPDICKDKFKEYGGIWLTIESEGLSDVMLEKLIGDRGRQLDALQTLLNVTMNLNAGDDDRQLFTVECNEFRTSRYSELADMAVTAAEEVRSSQQDYEMPPMSSAERRLVHTLLVDDVDLTTYSRGQDRDRRLIVTLAAASS